MSADITFHCPCKYRNKPLAEFVEAKQELEEFTVRITLGIIFDNEVAESPNMMAIARECRKLVRLYVDELKYRNNQGPQPECDCN